jgi:hypothetical protein
MTSTKDTKEMLSGDYILASKLGKDELVSRLGVRITMLLRNSSLETCKIPQRCRTRSRDKIIRRNCICTGTAIDSEK